MKIINLPNLGHEHTLPYARMGKRIGWTAHRVRTHIAHFCTKHTTGCSTEVQLDQSPNPDPNATLCINCKNTVWNMGAAIEHERQTQRTNTRAIMEHIFHHIPEELRTIILDYQFEQNPQPIKIMQLGWDSDKACNWRVDKFHDQAALELYECEKDYRESIADSEPEVRQIKIEWLTYGG